MNDHDMLRFHFEAQLKYQLTWKYRVKMLWKRFKEWANEPF